MTPRQTARLLSLVAGLIGAVGMAGWIAGIEALKRLHPSWVTMKANTAAALMLAAVAVGMLAAPALTLRSRRTIAAIGVFLLLLGGLTFTEHAFGWDLGIDQLLFTESVAAAGRSFPGRMGVASSLIFVCLGLALTVPDARLLRRLRASEALTLVAAMLNYTIFLCYFYHVELPPELQNHLSIALHTVVAFGCLFCGLLLSRPEGGVAAVFLSSHAGGQLARRLLPTAVLLPSLLGWVLMMGREAQLYGRGVAIAVLAATVTFAFTWLVWHTARAVNALSRARRAVEDGLRRSELELADFFENAGVAIHSTTADGVILRANRAELAMLGWERSEFVGRRLDDFLVEPGTLEPVHQRLARAGEVRDATARLRRKDGGECEVVISASVYRVGDEFVHTRWFLRDVTTLNRAVSALRLSEEKIALAAATAGFAVHDFDVRTGAVLWSDRLFEMTGIPRSESLTLRTAVDLIHPDDHGRVQRAMELALDPAGDGHFAEEFRILRADSGECRWFYNQCRTTFADEDGRRTAVRNTGVVTDVTERKLAEERLRASEERYRAFIRNSSEGIWRLEFDPPVDTSLPVEDQVRQAYAHGRLLECNDIMAQMYGLPGADDIVGKSIDFMLPETDAAAREWIASIIRAGYRVSNAESTERGAHGETLHFLNSMYGVVENGQLFRMWGTQRDISDWKRAETALRSSEERFRGTFDNAAVGMALVALDGRWLRVNDRVCEVTGYAREELLGMTFADITHPEDLAEDIENAERLVRGEAENYAVEKRYLRRDGSVVWVNLTVSLQRDWDERPLYFISVIEDITEKRRSADERTAALRAAEAASRAKDDFLAALSHELRTPLTPALLTVADLTEDPTVPAWIQGHLQGVAHNITLEARLIDDLLDLTRVSTGKLELRRVAVDVHTSLRRVLEIVRADSRQRRLELSLIPDALRPWVLADATRLQQVFWNLLKNAVKFTPDGGRVTVRTGHTPEGDVVISVEDTGCGIAAEALPRIFRPFDQGGPGGHSFGGLGLGLAISKAIVEQHGACLSVTSDGPGQGAIFTVTLQATDPPPDQPAPEPPAPPQTVQRSLLVVDDHADSLRTLVHLLSRRGYRVRSATSVEEGVAEVARERPDVLVTDLGLPDGTGVDLLRRVRGSFDGPAIALSGYGMPSDVERTRDAGFAAHLTKPVAIADLVAAIEAAAAR